MIPALTDAARKAIAEIRSKHRGPLGVFETVTAWRLHVGELLRSIAKLEVENDRLRTALRDVARHHAAGDRASVRYALDDAGFGRSW